MGLEDRLHQAEATVKSLDRDMKLAEADKKITDAIVNLAQRVVFLEENFKKILDISGQIADRLQHQQDEMEDIREDAGL